MSNYQGLSRAYRPQTFSAVLGQEAIVTTLKNALRQKKTAQAYLFCGTRGTGKTTLARILAKALNCPNLSKDSEPCNECPSCLEITQGKNLNVLEIDGASNRGIDDIRQLNETVAYAPTAFGCKIFIIDEAHMLTKEAFNALLKTLEEPPPNTKFFLATTEVHKIPPTIISRCQKFDLQRIQTATLTHKLIDILKSQSISYEEEAIHALSCFADGSMRVAESLLDQILCFSEGLITEKQVAESLGTLPTEAFFIFDHAFAQSNNLFAFTFANQVFTSGKDLGHFFECLLEHYRNLLSTKLELFLEKIPSSLQEKYVKSATFYTEEQLLYILDYLIEWHDKIHKSPCKKVTLEMALLHILRSKHRVCVADLVLRLEELKEAPSQIPLLIEKPQESKLSLPKEVPPKQEAPVIETPVRVSLELPPPEPSTQPV
ncbi:MAG: DNA polymerase III subunit gamma/tau, partial [Verrucomicrobia bacterium]|nr:DNA polymerase III subunit gamma/tau [Verrucomicrobiota bacterium]